MRHTNKNKKQLQKWIVLYLISIDKLITMKQNQRQQQSLCRNQTETQNIQQIAMGDAICVLCFRDSSFVFINSHVAIAPPSHRHENSLFFIETEWERDEAKWKEQNSMLWWFCLMFLLCVAQTACLYTAETFNKHHQRERNRNRVL